MLRETVEKLIDTSPLSENYKRLWHEALEFMDTGELELMKDVLEKLPFSDVVEFSRILEEKVAQYQAEEEQEWEKIIGQSKK